MYQPIRREQKEAVGLLSIGTFLEYFDLMLFVHLAHLLNDLFFPKVDPKTEMILAFFAFWSTYLLRPVGALVFGYIGDRIGRKFTIQVTTLLMAGSCITMALVPTYSEIGIYATIIVTLCRMLQGVSSMGEIIGSEIYLTESFKPPLKAFFVALISSMSAVGTFAAIAMGALVVKYSIDWRIAFWIGAVIAVIGRIARTHLREAPDYSDMKLRLKKFLESESLPRTGIVSAIRGEKVKSKTMITYTFLAAFGGIMFFFTYIYCGSFLKTKLNFTSEDVLSHNLIVSAIDLLVMLCYTLASLYANPLKILRWRVAIYAPLLAVTPLVFAYATNGYQIMLLQVLTNALLGMGLVPAVSSLIENFPILIRFRYISVLYALSRVVAYTLFPLVFYFAVENLGTNGMYLVFIPMWGFYLWGVNYFIKLEKEQPAY